MKFLMSIFSLSLLYTTIYAKDIATVASELNLYAGTKATVQWERVFLSQRHMKRYNLNQVPEKLRNELKIYLIKHAADSEQPIVPGL